MAAKDIEPHKFPKGKSGNPKGRPKGTGKLPALDKLLASVLSEEKDGQTAAEAILKALRKKAANGDIRAAETLFDRAYGKPKQHLEHTGANGGPIQTTVIKFIDDSTDADNIG
jgi:hypothetical protein